MINESTGKTINNSKFKDTVIRLIEQGESDPGIMKILRKQHNFETDTRTLKAFRKNFILSDKEALKKITELKKKQEEKIKKIQDVLPAHIFESIEARKAHIKILQEQVEVTSRIQKEIHEFRNQKVADIKSIYEKLTTELHNCKITIENDKEKSKDKKEIQIGEILTVQRMLEELKRLPVEKALTLYRAGNDALIMKSIDEIRVLRGEVEQYTSLYNLQELIDLVAKKIIDIVGEILIPEIDKNKVTSIVPRFKNEVNKIVDELKDKTLLEVSK
jgi:hypothetical protein